MRRTERLFDIIQVFRDGKLHRGEELAERMEVSLRTIYRDIETLVASGVPITGERGVGYLMTGPVFLPPLNITQGELEVLELGLALVRGGPSKLWFRMLMSCSAWDCQFPGRRCPPVWKAPDCDCQ